MPLGKRTGCQGTKVRKSKAPGKERARDERPAFPRTLTGLQARESLRVWGVTAENHSEATGHGETQRTVGFVTRAAECQSRC